MPKFTRHGFGSEAGLSSVISSGVANEYDVLFLSHGDGTGTGEIVWLDKQKQVVYNVPRHNSVWTSKEEADAYALTASAYGGQIVTALVNGEYVAYALQPSEAGYVLKRVGADESMMKQYVVVGTRPTEGMEQGVLYIDGNAGYIWTGTEWKLVFENVSVTNPEFSGSVTIDGKEVATQEWVNTLVGQMSGGVPGIIDAENPFPVADYKAGQMWRVALDGNYAGVECEVGDLIICLKDCVAETASDNDFMVIQANVDGAVTGADASTDGHIVIFNGSTGKVIKDSSVSIDSLNDAIAKAHEHSNLAVLESFVNTQEEIITQAVNTTKTAFEERLGDIPAEETVKAYVDRVAGAGSADVATEISTAKDEAIEASNTYTDEQIAAVMSIIEF